MICGPARADRAAVQRLEREAHEQLAQHSATGRLLDRDGSAQPCHTTGDGDSVLAGAENQGRSAAARLWREHEARRVGPACIDRHRCAQIYVMDNRMHHAARWLAFAAAPPACITYDDVPWPPTDACDLLSGIAAYSIEMQPCSEPKPAAKGSAHAASRGVGMPSAADRASDSTQRRAHRVATLRWHPDKFEQRFGSAIVVADRERVLQRIQEICQGLNDLRSASSL